MAWNGSRGAEAPKVEAVKKAPSTGKGLIAGLAVALVGFAVWFFVFNKSEAPKDADESARSNQIAEATPAKGGRLPDALKSDKVKSAKDAAKRVADKVAGKDETDVADDADENEKKEPPEDKRLFKNPMDQLLAMVMPTRPGDAVPPPPIDDSMTFTEEQEKDILERFVANKEDTDKQLERKDIVQGLRDEYFKLKKEGWTFMDYIKALYAKTSLDADVLTESAKLHDTIFNDVNVSDAEYLTALEKINKVLTDRGIDPIKIPQDEENEEGNTDK